MRWISIALIFAPTISKTSAQGSDSISRVHYFYNSGWLVETKHHLLVFDFIPHAESNISFDSLLEELKKASVPDKELLIFISHDHKDHFNDSIFALKARNLTTEFILGWKPVKHPEVATFTILSAGDSVIRKGLSVFTHPATDDGSAFLVKVDGVVIYHAGDHALWADDLLSQFTKQLMEIKNKTGEVDLAFIPAARGMFAKCAVDSTVEKGVQLSISILKPKVAALQHIGCEDKLFQYEQVSKRLVGIHTRWISPVKYNSSYSFY